MFVFKLINVFRGWNLDVKVGLVYEFIFEQINMVNEIQCFGILGMGYVINFKLYDLRLGMEQFFKGNLKYCNLGKKRMDIREVKIINDYYGKLFQKFRFGLDKVFFSLR